MFKLLKYDDFLEYDEASGTYSMSSEQRVRDETEKFKWKHSGFTLLKDWRLYVMLIPMIFVYIFWKYMPLYELVAVFKTGNETEALDRTWTGLENFKYIFGLGSYKGELDSTLFWMAFRNTFILSFYGLLFGFPIPIILALFFNEIRSNVLRSILQVCVYLPKFLSTVVVTTLLLALFRGSDKASGQEVGIVSRFAIWITGSPRLISEAQGGLLFSATYFRALYEISNAWEAAGYGSIVYFAAVISISPTSYEAAQIDGAGKMAQMRYVVIPNILSTVVIMLIMKIGSLLSVGYEKLYLLCPGPTASYANYEVATVVSTFANYLSGGEGKDLTTAAYGMAAEMTNNLIGMVLVIGANAVAKRAANVSLY